MNTARQPQSRTPGTMVAVSLVLALLAGACSQPASDAAAADTNTTPGTEIVTVEQRDATDSVRVAAVVAFGPARVLPTFSGGTITWAPAQDSVLSVGDVAIMIDNKPVTLAAGEIPMYRELRQVPFFQLDRAGNPVGLQSGPDIDQLQAFLIDEGFDAGGRLQDEEAFGPHTDEAVRAWQATVGHAPDGILNGKHLVFVSDDIRVASDLIVGESFTTFSYTGTDIILTIQAQPAQRKFFLVDSTVDVRAGDDNIEGTVIKSTRTLDQASQSARQTVLVAVDDVSPDELGQTVDVYGTAVEAEDALIVPVRALLALSEGGWAVEVPTAGDDTDLVGVELVDVVGTDAIIGGLEAGTEVVVPT